MVVTRVARFREITVARRPGKENGRGRRSIADGFLIHVLFNGDFSESAAVVTLVAADPPLFDPFLLHIGLTAFGTDEYSLLVEDPAFFFHGGGAPSRARMAQREREFQGVVTGLEPS
jgi:hypothetical protein